ncbi:MAG: radical SAM family heme chaperone HemW [Bacteroidales bacterium]|nr:radical SAM family heme chaperone HemW [Bacteroidales bacterium]
MEERVAPRGLYIHIPFCKSRCIYCGFFSQTNFSIAAAYVDALIYEMQRYDLSQVRTIYLGGGTPSTLGVLLLTKLFDYLRNNIDMCAVEEFTVECNPDDVSDELAALMCRYGVNRVSMGAQSMNDQMLRFLSRRHTAAQVSQAIAHLEACGIYNINIDFIFGMPAFDWYKFETDFEQFAAIHTQHKSIYALSYEEGTPLSRMLADGKITALPDDEVRTQYEYITARMQQLGYEHYEISNYAQPQHRAIHNCNYWNRTSYVGIGVGSSSFWGSHRHTNNMSLADYCSLPPMHRNPTYENDELAQQDIYNEIVMLGLRTSDGVNINDIKRLGNKYYEHFLQHASSLQNCGDRYYLAETDWFISDYIVSGLFL